MATWQYELVDPPSEPRAAELWLQHAAGFILFEDVRRHATDQIDPALTLEVRAAVQKGIDDSVYGLMMVMQGVSGGLSNREHAVDLQFTARVTTRTEGGGGGGRTVLTEVNLGDGDGMCMGYHYWIDGDFGQHPVAVRKPDARV